MQRSLCLTLLILAAACSTARSGSEDRRPADIEDDSENASGDDGRDTGAGEATNEAGVPIEPTPGIDGGAVQPTPPDKPPPYVSFDAMITAMREDVRKILNPVERTDIRYLVLSHLGNAGLRNADIAVHQSTMNLLVNSLSRGALLVAPVQLAAAPNVYRINLRDYRWTPELWEAIVADYPYQVEYNQDSRRFSRDEASAAALRAATGTVVPFVFMEWFTAKVVRAPLYYQLLNFPDTLAALGTQVDVDIAADIAQRRIARAGVSGSMFAKQNRMFERHDRIGNIGTFWLSYDFSQSSGLQNIFEHPLDFTHAGQEVIYALPNGLSAYMVVDGAGKRLDAAPFELVADGRAPNGIATPGLSCMGGCHYANGFEPIKDEVLSSVVANTPAGVDADVVRAVFPTQNKLDALIESDRKGYVAAAISVGVNLSIENAPYQTVELYNGQVDLALAAALLQVTEEEMNKALLTPSLAVPAQIRSLRDGKPVNREVFEGLFGKAVCALGIGEPLCAARDCGCATLTP